MKQRPGSGQRPTRGGAWLPARRLSASVMRLETEVSRSAAIRLICFKEVARQKA